MRLQATNIRKTKKLPLSEVRVLAPPTSEPAIPAAAPLPTQDEPPRLTSQETAFQELVKINPLILELAERLRLTDVETGNNYGDKPIAEDSNAQEGDLFFTTVEDELKHSIPALPDTNDFFNGEKRDRKRSSGEVDICLSNSYRKAELLGILSEKGKAAERKKPDTKEDKILRIAREVIAEQNSYTKEEIIERIITAKGISRSRAENGFNLMAEAGIIEPTLGDKYYLAGSTPF